MEIGAKLKNARTKSGLTQEKVAEEIGVSRQSVSNWENGRSYPDIVSVIKLSDLYSVSLDELLKEDKKMIYYMDESTNIVRSRKRLITLIEIGGYLLIWTFSVLAYWAAYGYSLLASENTNIQLYIAAIFDLVFPINSAVLSAFVGAESGSKLKWLVLPLLGLSDVLGLYVTNRLSIIAATKSLELFYFISPAVLVYFLFGAGVSAVGMAVGMLIRRSKIKKQTE